MDEPKSLGNNAQLMVFVRFHEPAGCVEQFLFCCPLDKHTTGEEMLKQANVLIKISFRGLTACFLVPIELQP